MEEPVIILTKGPSDEPVCVLCGEPISLSNDWPQWHKADKFAPTGVTHRNCAYAVQLLHSGETDFLPGEFGSLSKVMRETPSTAFIAAFADLAIHLSNVVEAQIAAEQTRRKAQADFRLKPARIVQPTGPH